MKKKTKELIGAIAAITALLIAVGFAILVIKLAFFS